MLNAPTVPVLLFAANYQRETLPQGPEATMSFVPSDLGYSTPIPTVDTEPFIGASTNYDDGIRFFPPGQAHAGSADLPSSAHFQAQPSEDTFPRQVGTHAGTQASKAPRTTATSIFLLFSGMQV
ncbi:hypothetical protein PM082_004971 [Marasmius tenuissimus]|nr:hypothetical protein PM082_004971 [Marasmius tenuissimus]